MIKTVILGLVSIATAAATSTNADETSERIPCRNNEYCKENGYSFCLFGACGGTKRCKTDQQCHPALPFCNDYLGHCYSLQCVENQNCRKYNLSKCVDYKCKGPAIANDASTATSTAPTATPTEIPCKTDDNCKKHGFSFCYFDNTCVNRICKTDKACKQYDKYKPFCLNDTCGVFQCENDKDCKKYNKASCVNKQCVKTATTSQ